MVQAHDVFCSPEEEFRIQVAEILPNLYIEICDGSWNPNAGPCLDWKRPRFGGFQVTIIFHIISSAFLDQKKPDYSIHLLAERSACGVFFAMAMESPSGESGYTFAAILYNAELLESLLPESRSPSPESAIKLDYLEIVDGVKDAPCCNFMV